MKKFIILLVCFSLVFTIYPTVNASSYKALTVLSTSIKDKQQNVKIDSTIIIHFNNNIKKAGNFNKITITSSNKKIDCNISINKDSIILKSKAVLQYSTFYTLTVPVNAVVDIVKKPNTKCITITFKTDGQPLVKPEIKPENLRNKTYPLSDLKADYQEFKDTIDVVHPKLYTNKEELSELFDSQYKLLKDKMTEFWHQL